MAKTQLIHTTLQRTATDREPLQVYRGQNPSHLQFPQSYAVLESDIKNITPHRQHPGLNWPVLLQWERRKWRDLPECEGETEGGRKAYRQTSGGNKGGSWDIKQHQAQLWLNFQPFNLYYLTIKIPDGTEATWDNHWITPKTHLICYYSINFLINNLIFSW